MLVIKALYKENKHNQRLSKLYYQEVCQIVFDKETSHEEFFVGNQLIKKNNSATSIPPVFARKM
ncbi:hypothetical protein Syun_007471 [Stephania yunnanensis]|uniref:Uncharacterized protein n=1 Tax=Stephania yunnanensis TaxID=152371 RepID=A0AAP0L154_9MAGN